MPKMGRPSRYPELIRIFVDTETRERIRKLRRERCEREAHTVRAVVAVGLAVMESQK